MGRMINMIGIDLHDSLIEPGRRSVGGRGGEEKVKKNWKNS